MAAVSGALGVSLVGIFASAGCGPDLLYLPSLAVGQLALITRSVPIERALESGDLGEGDARKLRLIVDVRDYAREVMTLTAGDSYTTYFDNRGEFATTNVSASRKDRFEPVVWTFPIVGELPYLGFFDRGRAERYAAGLRDRGNDVLTYEVDAYSTLDTLPNPVQSAMLRRDDISLIDTVIHELLHNTVWRKDDVRFNESLATFFGRTGAVRYLNDRFPDQPDRVASARARFNDTDRYNAFMSGLYNELETYYASDQTGQPKIAGREPIFQAARDRFASEVQPVMNEPDRYDWVANLPTNNAWVLSYYRYNLDLDLFAEVFSAAGEDWERALQVFRQAADAGDAKGFLGAWVDQNVE